MSESTDQAEQRDGKPAHPPHGPVLDTDKNAGIVSRGIGAMLDLGVVGALMAGGYFGVALVRLLLNVRDFSLPHPHVIFTVTGFLAISVIYLAACWAISGRTLGSVVMGLRVVGRKGGRVRPVVALLRALICTFFAAGLVWAAVDSKRRSVADLLLRTRVVYSR